MPSRRSRREIITIQSPIMATDSYGQNVVSGYNDVLTAIRATYSQPTGTNSASGTETIRGRQVEAGVVGVFEIRKPRVEITPSMSVLHVSGDNKRYEIYAVRPSESKYEGGFRDVEILVKAIANG